MSDNLTSKAQKHIGGKRGKQNKMKQLSFFMLEKRGLVRGQEYHFGQGSQKGGS